MKLYAVVGILAVLAVHAVAAEETKESSPSTTTATDKVATGTKSNFGFDSSKYGIIQQSNLLDLIFLSSYNNIIIISSGI